MYVCPVVQKGIKMFTDKNSRVVTLVWGPVRHCMCVLPASCQMVQLFLVHGRIGACLYVSPTPLSGERLCGPGFVGKRYRELLPQDMA